MTNVFMTDLKELCGAMLHAIWVNQHSENPSVIPIDLAQDILSYLTSFREHEAILIDMIKESKLSNNPNGNNENDLPNTPGETNGSEPVETIDKNIGLNDAVTKTNPVEESVNQAENEVDESTASNVSKSAQNDHIAREEPSSASNDIITEQNAHPVVSEIDAPRINDTRHAVDLVTHFIDQMAPKQHHVVDEAVKPIDPFENVIQAEVVVTTMPDKPLKRSKRTPKTKADLELYLKRRRSMDYGLINKGIESNSDISSSNDGIAKKSQMTNPTSEEAVVKSKMKKAMEKRQSRKTICVHRPKIKEDEGEDDEVSESFYRNTDRHMYVNNEDFHKNWCRICKKPQKHLVAHYVGKHPDDEIPISRPSPAMATQLRQPGMDFAQIKGNLSGICWFCEQTKTLPKYKWVSHFLIHTGEKMFCCTDCDKTYKTKSKHTTCNQEPVNIHYTDPKQNAIMAWICKDCNHTQLYRGNIIKHLKNQHGYMGPEENYHYDQVMLVPDLERPKPKSSRTD